MIRAYRLYTGPDGHSHVDRGSVNTIELVDAQSIEFKETPPHSSYDGTTILFLSTSSPWRACSSLRQPVARSSRFALATSYWWRTIQGPGIGGG